MYPDFDNTELAPRILSEETTKHVASRLESLFRESGELNVTIMGNWTGELRWARNRVSLSSDRRDVYVFVRRTNVRGGSGAARTNQIDDESLAGVMRAAERSADINSRIVRNDLYVEPPILHRPQSSYLWSDATFERGAEENGAYVRKLTERAEANAFLTAGYVEMQGGSVGELDIDAGGRRTYYYDRYTQAQCSMTVRHPKGTASGWAGRSGYDWAKIDANALGGIALEKCLSSVDPVRIEPGRYTVILEPQAVADLVKLLFMSNAMDRRDSEVLPGVWTLGPDDMVNRLRTKLGLKIVDERVTISHDPEDPGLGIIGDYGLEPVVWIKNGILNQLNVSRERSVHESNDRAAVLSRLSFRMSGGDTSIDEMVATTKRGLLVTRLWGLRLIDKGSLLYTGVTRDGLYLIENGTITKAVRNFRFTESPLFVLNNIELLGLPVPVFNPNRQGSSTIGQPFLTPDMQPVNLLRSIVVPPLKVNDFSFTSTIDAV